MNSGKNTKKGSKRTLGNQIVIILLILAPTFYFGYIGKSVEMGIMLVASSITVAFLNIDKVQKFKGAGFEAEMRKVVDEASVTLENLKSVATPLIVTTIDALTWGKRLGDSDSNRDVEMFNKLIELVDELNLEYNQITNAIDEYYALKILDKYSVFKRTFKDSQASKNKSVVELNAIEKSLNEIIDFRVNKFPSKKTILETLNIQECGLNDTALKSLNEYIVYMEEISSKKSGKLNWLLKKWE